MSKLNKFTLLLWKNWKLQLRRPVITVFEILLPAMFCLILLELRTLTTPTVISNATVFPSYSIEGIPDRLLRQFRLGRIPVVGLAYTPNTAITTRIINQAGIALLHKTNMTFQPIMQGFDSEDDLVTYVTFSNGSVKNSMLYLGGVVFLNSDYATTVPNNITYKLRFSYLLRTSNQKTWQTSSTYPPVQSTGPRNGNDSFNPNPGYYSEGFLAVQNAINRAIVEELNPAARADQEYKTMDIKAQMFPYPPYIQDQFTLVLQSQMPLFIMLSLVFIALNIPKEVVHEKERKLKVNPVHNIAVRNARRFR